MTEEKLEDLRARIDELDLQILDLLNKRMSLSQIIGRLKAAENQSALDLVREEEILRRLEALNSGPMLRVTLDAIYREIFSGSRALQSPLTIAYLGPPGTHTHNAALKRFGNSHSFLPCFTVKEIFEEISRTEADYGIVPVENSVEGSVRETLDALMTSEIQICGEIALPIRHALLNRSGRMEDIQTVSSHPQALAQCRQWLNRHLPKNTILETSSTGKAAERAQQNPETAAVAHEAVAEIIGLKVIKRNIQDMQDNITRFLVLGRGKPAATGNDRTSIIFWTKNRPGALFKILQAFAAREVNLSRIESRPDRGSVPWEYAFFVDLEGHRDEPKVSTCLKDIEGQGTVVKILGSYPIHSYTSNIAEAPAQDYDQK
jgi:chorismate mutase/prephenate dehydratase